MSEDEGHHQRESDEGGHHDDGGDHHGHGPDDDHGHHQHDHGHHRHDQSTLGVAVVTISTSRTIEEDPSGDFIVSAMEDEGHEVAVRELVDDDYDGVQGIVDRLIDRADVNLIVTSGGTGVTPDDVTVDAVRPLFERELPGFGELFRRLSYEEIGARVVATRATAGFDGEVLICCLPGSEAAVRLGVEDIVLPEAPHLVGLAQRDRSEE